MKAASEIAQWLIGEGRLLGDGIAVVEGFALRLRQAGIPLWRLRINQQIANPLVAAWSVAWTPRETIEFTIPRSILDTNAWHGSPFQYVVENRTTFRRHLADLDRVRDHEVLFEIAQSGGTDFFAMALEFGDGTAQGSSFVSDDPNGFTETHITTIESLREPLSAALEPCAVRTSMRSLLRTYLGKGPARAVADGAIRRGGLEHLDAVIMFTDMRDFTGKTLNWPEQDMIEAMNDYFEIVVDAVHENGGDVLKFVGDAVLSVFPIECGRERPARCGEAVRAAQTIRQSLHSLNEQRRNVGNEQLELGTGLHIGQVTYGNVGSPDRLDFTVIGPAVNIASRLQDLCKQLGEPILATVAVQELWPSVFSYAGRYEIRGLREEQDIYLLHEPEAE